MKTREGLIRKTIGDLVRSGRKDRACPLTQAELAHRSGISCEHLNHIENYRATPSFDVLDRLARSLGHATVAELLDRDLTGVVGRAEPSSTMSLPNSPASGESRPASEHAIHASAFSR